MDYIKSFKNRGHSYCKAVTLYNNVLDEEITAALDNLQLEKNDVLLNIFAGGIPIDKYIKSDLNITYLAFDMHTDFIIDSIKKCSFDNIPIQSNSINKIICLATLHHLNISERTSLYNEFYRILVPSGRLVIADVIDTSPQAKWLNEFVNTYNSNGHKGLFFTKDDSNLIKDSNFLVETSINEYNWNFNNDIDLLHFFKLLFGLDLCIDDTSLLHSIKEYLYYNNRKFPWKVIYFNCVKM
jgi:SAM-dependent methyltransferase